MSVEPKKWGVIYNPKAGTRKVKKRWKEIKEYRDGEDNVQVNGSSSFKIHVNGKPNNMMSNNPKEVLKSMPANTIKYIEVITSPGAKYDAEGIGGILIIAIHRCCLL